MRKAFNKIIRRMAKMFMPDAKQLSVMAASACQEFINQQPEDRAAKIARASDIASKLSDIQSKISKALADGKLDDEETAKLAEMLEPVIAHLMEKI